MMKINHILYFGTLLLMAGCSSEEDLSDGTLSGNGKTPLLIEATLSTGNAVTRAAGDAFVTNDKLLVYLRHTTEGSKGSYTTTDADQAPKLVTLTKSSDGFTPTLYWDDFSVGGKGDATDLRTSGHGLQSYYGYCYNGGTPSTALTEGTGVLGWTVATDQRTAINFQHSDLLWSAEQDAVAYDHASAQSPASGHGTLTIPFTHAMSEVTVSITCGAGFDGSTNPLSSTTLTLNAMNTVTTFTAPTSTLTSGTPTTVQMFAEAYTSGALTRNFTAIVAPGTKLKVDEKLLDIVNVEDNNYEVKITSSMVPKDVDSDDSNYLAWSENHTVSTESTKAYILTKPGYNYHLDITLSKTAIEVEATIQDWTTVNATGTGTIQYPNDVVTMNVTGDNFAEHSTFSLFWQQANGTENDEESERTDNATYTFATVPEVNSSNVWVNTPTIYWPNQSNQYYFRALAQFNSTTSSMHSITKVGALDPLDNGTDVSQGTIATGHDILWGTTPAHTGSPNSNSFTAGQAIPPRTGDVPIAFEHAMSKVTFQLETTDDATVTVNNAKVDLTNATIAVSNLATTGTISIETGTITPAATTAAAIAATAAPISELIVIPQDISNDAIVTITLADGTTYKLQLNQCVVSGSSTPITTWQRGKDYTYTIHIEKEQISFRALIQDWDTVTGSGNANLEWD